MAYVCGRCEDSLTAELRRVATVEGEAATTIARQARITAGGSGGRISIDPEPWAKNPDALYPNPLPVNLSAAADHHAAMNTLTTWARHIAEVRGLDLPPAQDCPHRSCGRVRAAQAVGPACLRPLEALAAWLERQLQWLRHRAEADEAYDELGDACRVLVRIVDRQPERIVVGQCPCNSYLYAVRGAAQVKCGSCGTSYAVDETRDMLRRSLDQSLFTAAEIATLVTYLGLPSKREQIRHRINVWATRGLVISHADYHGTPAYRFGEVVARLMAG